MSTSAVGSRPGGSLKPLFWVLAFCGVCAGISFLVRPGESEDEGGPASELGPTTPSFTGTSDKLAKTAFVHTLETPIPAGRSAVWSAGVSLAWKELEGTGKGPIQLPKLAVLAEQLRREAAKPSGLDAKDYYAAAGFSSHNILEKITREVKQKFPTATPPAAPPEAGLGYVLTYAHVEVTMKYIQAFFQEEDPFHFRGSAGERTQVHAFGIRIKDKGKAGSFRDQVGPLFHDGQGHYGVDLSRGMMPYQVLVACLDRDTTLAQMLEQLEHRSKNDRGELAFGDESILLVPNMDWSVDHTYRELDGQPVHAEGWPDAGEFLYLKQSMRFRMNREGVRFVVKVEGAVTLLDGDEPHKSGHFIFDRPYLLVLRKRGETHPFFVMWVDNAELLYKK